MSIGSQSWIVLGDGPGVLRPKAQRHNGGGIGSVSFGEPSDRHSINVQSCSVEHLLAVADAFQEAARLLRQVELRQMVPAVAPRQCRRCGEQTHTLSTDDLCDGCVAGAVAS